MSRIDAIVPRAGAFGSIGRSDTRPQIVPDGPFMRASNDAGRPFAISVWSGATAARYSCSLANSSAKLAPVRSRPGCPNISWVCELNRTTRSSARWRTAVDVASSTTFSSSSERDSASRCRLISDVSWNV